jgi:hypothetical protein
MPVRTFRTNENLATDFCTSGIKHCRLLPPGITGAKVKSGSVAERSAK